MRSQRALDWLNFFVADVESAFGPFIAVYLTTEGWGQAAIGSVLTLSNLIALGTQSPAGWLVDHLRVKRLIVGTCLACVAGGAMLIAFVPFYPAVAVGEGLHGISGGALRTALAAIAIGLVGHRALGRRVGRNQLWNSAGNAAAAAGMGALGTFVSYRMPLFAGAALCVPAAIALLSIRNREISFARARQAPRDDERKAERWRVLLKDKGLLAFTLVLTLFQFANASLLPLASERLAQDFKARSDLLAAALVVVPQLVAAGLAPVIARWADERGRRQMLLLAFSALVLRAGLYAFAFNPWYVVGVSAFGGLDASVIGVLMPLVVADCTRGTGRYNVTLGLVGTISILGATVSTTAMGFIAE